MGKKTKLGKRRKDRFYHLAKEAGYRARSAFKLVQLNRKYHFLQSSRVLIDLCAAPGGWLQVAVKAMPISSLILGVDLVPIKPIPNVITIQEDITAARCKQLLQRELKTWKVDCVLNDGAPNVGTAWVQDAFSQAELSLSALKLACAFLREGGWFITKVFRSKDYQPFMWVLQQLFKSVHSTKPQASRMESAEIFVVCKGYLAPTQIDEKLLDPRHVFQDVEKKTEEKISLSKLQKPSKLAEGYPDNVGLLFKTTPVSDFILKDNYLSILKESNKLVFDRAGEMFSHHPLTTDDICEGLKDLRVLGPRELKQLVKWREKMRSFVDSVGAEKEEMKNDDVGEEDGLLKGIDDKIKALASSEAAEVKREVRRLRKQRKKLKERLVMKGTSEESGELIRQEYLFRLKDIKTKCHLEQVEKREEGESGGSDGECVEEEGSRESDGECVEEEEEMNDEEERMDNGEGEVHKGEHEHAEDNPLLVSLKNESAAGVRSSRTESWFSKDIFQDMEKEDDEDCELQQMMKSYVSEGGQQWTKKVGNAGGEEEGVPKKSESGVAESSNVEGPHQSRECGLPSKSGKQDELQVVPVSHSSKRKLDPEGLALGALMVQSKKKREDLIESGYNRWTHNDGDLPDWFAQDEAKFCLKRLPITKEMVEVYRAKLREINARPIKKVAEAKARKKRKLLKSMEKARKKAEGIVETEDASSHEKAQQIRQIYKKAGIMAKKKKGNVEYVVAKKGLGKKVRRPAGVKGHFKVVDPRMKKDNRGKAATRGKGKMAGRGKGNQQRQRNRK